jgi:cytochrome P450
MFPPFVTSLARKVPPGGDVIDGYYIPGGTTVACHHYASYHSSANFYKAGEWHPERWLDPSHPLSPASVAKQNPDNASYQDDAEGFSMDNKDVLNPFSLGPYGCLGKNLAYAEMRLILASVLWKFDMELCEESLGWVERMDVYFLWDKDALWIKLKEWDGMQGAKWE